MTRKIISEDDVVNIITNYKKGDSLNTVGKMIHVRSDVIRDILVNNGISIRGSGEQTNKDNYITNKKYTFNENFFEIIDNELKAYWLGFIFADGNVYIPKYKEGKTKGGRVDIALKAEDDYHLGNFGNDINGTMDVIYRDMKIGDKIHPSCRITANSIKMAKDLINHGCTPKKSLTLEFPNHLPKELLPHFIRGYIDGDGCVFFKVYEKTDNFHLSMLGTVDFLTGVRNVLIENGIKCADIKPQKSQAFSFHVFGQDNLVKLYNYLYKDATRFLGRKIDKYRQAMLYFDKDFEISPTAKLFCLLDDELEELKFDKWYKKTDLYRQVQEFRQTDLYKQIQQQQ